MKRGRVNTKTKIDANKFINEYNAYHLGYLYEPMGEYAVGFYILSVLSNGGTSMRPRVVADRPNAHYGLTDYFNNIMTMSRLLTERYCSYVGKETLWVYYWDYLTKLLCWHFFYSKINTFIINSVETVETHTE